MQISVTAQVLTVNHPGVGGGGGWGEGGGGADGSTRRPTCSDSPLDLMSLILHLFTSYLFYHQTTGVVLRVSCSTRTTVDKTSNQLQPIPAPVEDTKKNTSSVSISAMKRIF